MRLTYAEKQAAHRRRLVIVTPIAAVLVALIFVTSDVVPYSEIEQRFGWEGEIRLLPNITILPDDDPFEDTRRSSRLAALASVDVDILKERADSEGGANEPVTPEEPEPIPRPELDLEEVRHYPAHTDISYSEDYVILHMVQPEYPPFELLQGIEGDVTVELLVNENGRVENAWILTSLGPKSFEEASLAATNPHLVPSRGQERESRIALVVGEQAPGAVECHQPVGPGGIRNGDGCGGMGLHAKVLEDSKKEPVRLLALVSGLTEAQFFRDDRNRRQFDHNGGARGLLQGIGDELGRRARWQCKVVRERPADGFRHRQTHPAAWKEMAVDHQSAVRRCAAMPDLNIAVCTEAVRHRDDVSR